MVFQMYVYSGRWRLYECEKKYLFSVRERESESVSTLSGFGFVSLEENKTLP